MTLDRSMELLNAMIDNLSVAENNTTVIKHLLHVGFTKDELITDFNFAESDVVYALESMDDYESSLIFT